MIIKHPILGPRDIHEFIYLGDASLLNRPNWNDDNADSKFYEYLYHSFKLNRIIAYFKFLNSNIKVI